jgi:hypothetical protein
VSQPIEDLAREALEDSCFAHTDCFEDQAEHYHRLRTREPALAREVIRLRAWLEFVRGRAELIWKVTPGADSLGLFIEEALRGAPAPAADPDAENMHE